MDSDTLLLRPLDDLWSLFAQLSSNQFMALVPEDRADEPGKGIAWYKHKAKFPHYGEFGMVIFDSDNIMMYIIEIIFYV